MEDTVDVVIPYSSKHTPEIMLDKAKKSVASQSVPTRLYVITDHQQKGPAWARNQGIIASESRFMTFLDADDLWKENKLQKQIDETSRTHAGLCVEGINMNKYTFIKGLLLGDISSLTSSILIDKKYAEELLFDESIYRFEDHLFMINHALESGVCFCQNLTSIKKHNGGLSANTDPKLAHQAQLDLHDKLQRLSKDGHTELNQLLKHYQRFIYYSHGVTLRKNHEYMHAAEALCKSLKLGVNIYNIRSLFSLPGYYIKDKINTMLLHHLTER